MTSKQYEPVAPHKVAFLGLGVMGYPMAGHLKRAGHEVTVYNRTSAKADQWAAEYGGKSAPTPRQAARAASGIIAAPDRRPAPPGLAEGRGRGHHRACLSAKGHHTMIRGIIFDFDGLFR